MSTFVTRSGVTFLLTLAWSKPSGGPRMWEQPGSHRQTGSRRDVTEPETPSGGSASLSTQRRVSAPKEAARPSLPLFPSGSAQSEGDSESRSGTAARPARTLVLCGGRGGRARAAGGWAGLPGPALLTPWRGVGVRQQHPEGRPAGQAGWRTCSFASQFPSQGHGEERNKDHTFFGGYKQRKSFL